MPRRDRGDEPTQLHEPAADPEFSRPLRAGRLPPDGARVADKATEEERRALALRFSVAEVRRLSVEAQVLPEGPGWRVSGVARARVVQPCVVTLEPVVQLIEERFSRRLEPGAPPPDLTNLDPDEPEDPPEPLGEWIDPAEMAAEAVALAIEPYPRSADAAFDGRAVAPPGADGPLETVKPFAALAALRARLADPDEDPDAGPAPDAKKTDGDD